jgi:DNA-binding HxlR family transcriptional regulator
MDVSESLLRAILATVARTAFPPTEIYKIVAPVAGSNKQVVAYNLCDGKTPQAEISKRAKLDSGNLSRSISRWVEAGIVVRVGGDQHPMHVYPLTKSCLKSCMAER